MGTLFVPIFLFGSVNDKREQQMKKILSAVMVLLLLLNGCTKVKLTDLKVLTPAGAPAIALIPLMIENSEDEVVVVDGTDVISAELVKGDYDAIVAPVNLGLTLASKGNSDYILYGVLTWGNLYVVAAEGSTLDQAGDMALFGQAAVPQKIWNTVKSSLGSVRNEVYYNAVADVQLQLLTKAMNIGLMAEPALSATIAKAKTQGITLSIVADVQESWKSVTGSDNYPQAGLFIKKDADSGVKNSVKARFVEIQEFLASMTSNPDSIVSSVEEVGAERLGIASAAIIKTAWDRMNVEAVLAKDAQDEIQAFMDLFGLSNVSEYIDK